MQAWSLQDKRQAFETNRPNKRALIEYVCNQSDDGALGNVWCRGLVL